MRVVRAFALASATGLIFHCACASAQLAGKGEAGELWETTLKMEMVGMPMSMPAQTHRMCLSKQAGDDKYVPRQENCKVTDTRRTGNTQHFRMVCTGNNAMTAEGDVTHAGTSYTGKMRMSGKMEGQNVEMSQTFSGKKVGDCTG
jgi:Protein of unknown function (DUF3617)